MEVIKESKDGKYQYGTQMMKIDGEDGQKVDKEYLVLKKVRKKMGTLDTGRTVLYDDDVQIFFEEMDKKTLIELLS